MNVSPSDAKVTLSYFDFDGGRGQACRLALHLAGVDFHDDRIKRADWAEKKPTTPFGGVPVLTIKGQGVLAQSNAILGLIGAAHDLLPDDNFAAARHVAIIISVEEFVTRLFAGGNLDDAARKKQRQEFAAGYMKDWADALSAQITGPFVGGDKISVADLKLYVNINSLKSGFVDHIAPDFFDAYPKFVALHGAVASHPKVMEFEGRT